MDRSSRKHPLLALVVLLTLLVAVWPPMAHGAAAAASLQVSRSVAAPTYPIAVTGRGFAPGDTVVVSTDFTVQGHPQRTTATAGVDQSGTFSATLTVPGGTAQGTYRLTARDFHGHTANADLTIRPLVVMRVGQPAASITVIAGHTFFVRGTGFTPGATIAVTGTFPLYNGNSVNVSKNATADKNGNFGDLLLRAPNGSKQGTVALTAAGPKNKTQAHLAVVYRPTLSISSAVLRPGESVGIRGAGFVPNARVAVSIAVAQTGSSQTQTLTQMATADANGSFTTSLALPASLRPGTYTVAAKGQTAGLTTSGKLVVAVHPTVSVQPGSASPGQNVVVNGGGFSGGVSVTLTAVVPLYGGGSKTVSFATKTNASGAFSTHLSLPGNTAAGSVAVTAKGPHSQASAKFQVRRLGASITVSPASVIPGASVIVKGSGYPAGDKVSIAVVVTLSNGQKQTLTATATADKRGAFTAALKVPGNAAGGSFTVVGRSSMSGRAPNAKLLVTKLAPSIVAVPTSAAPGTQVTVDGFGFAAGQTVTVTLQGSTVGTATSNAAGKFTVKVTIPTTMATGRYTLEARGSAGHTASIPLAVNRSISTNFYFASIYTGRGYHEYLAILNSTATQGRVTITYEPTVGAAKSKVIAVNPHSRFTEDVNADLGTHVSAAATVAADVPIAAERYVLHGSDGAVVPGVRKPATIWYFANGNTSKGYRTYVAVQNPNNTPVQVVAHFLPTHHPAFAKSRSLNPMSRTTFKVNSFVPRDAVGVTITASGPVVANRTIFVHHGMTSKIGITTPQRTWYFAAGPRNQAARHWIGIINPSNSATHITVRAYGPFGVEHGTVSAVLQPHARVGYLMNRIAHTTDVAVVITASAPVVAEQTTYVGRMHDASTDAFGVASPAKSWQFAAVNTSATNGSGDVLDLFNPNLTSIPIVVQFMTASGSVSQRTFVVGPLYHQYIDVQSAVPNAQLGIVAASNYPFVALNRMKFNFGHGGDTSSGIHA